VNRIDRRFAALKAAGRTGLIPFVTAGDPSPESVVPLMHALVAAGADVIELGVPFSDPMADGPVIQHASERAIAKGVGLHQVLARVREFRADDTDTPIVLMGYLNPIEMYGYASFATDAAAAGVDGVLLVDCPIEESGVLSPLRKAGLSQILLAAPTTAPDRLERLCEAAAGFLYYVSFAGITGAAQLSTSEIAERVASIRARSRAPVAVGFGVRDAESAKAIAAFADAVVIGSALVERLAGAETAEDAAAKAEAFLAPIRAALDAR
jgi:tryptophan synthase alpha chain